MTVLDDHRNRPRSPLGRGRIKGSKNKATGQIRAAIALIVEKNIPRLQANLDKLAKHNPRAYVECVTNLVEFAIPKLSRLELRPPVVPLPAPVFGISFVNGGPGLPVPDHMRRRIASPPLDDPDIEDAELIPERPYIVSVQLKDEP